MVSSSQWTLIHRWWCNFNSSRCLCSRWWWINNIKLVWIIIPWCMAQTVWWTTIRICKASTQWCLSNNILLLKTQWTPISISSNSSNKTNFQMPNSTMHHRAPIKQQSQVDKIIMEEVLVAILKVWWWMEMVPIQLIHHLISSIEKQKFKEKYSLQNNYS